MPNVHAAAVSEVAELAQLHGYCLKLPGSHATAGGKLVGVEVRARGRGVLQIRSLCSGAWAQISRHVLCRNGSYSTPHSNGEKVTTECFWVQVL